MIPPFKHDHGQRGNTAGGTSPAALPARPGRRGSQSHAGRAPPPYGLPDATPPLSPPCADGPHRAGRVGRGRHAAPAVATVPPLQGLCAPGLRPLPAHASRRQSRHAACWPFADNPAYAYGSGGCVRLRAALRRDKVGPVRCPRRCSCVRALRRSFAGPDLPWTMLAALPAYPLTTRRGGTAPPSPASRKAACTSPGVSGSKPPAIPDMCFSAACRRALRDFHSPLAPRPQGAGRAWTCPAAGYPEFRPPLNRLSSVRSAW